MIERIAGYVREGNFFNTSCWSVGIDPTTGGKWMNRGRIDTDKNLDTLEGRFFLAVQDALAASEREGVHILRNSGGQYVLAMLRQRHQHWRDPGKESHIDEVRQELGRLQLERERIAIELEKLKLARLQGGQSGLTDSEQAMADEITNRFKGSFVRTDD